MTYFHSLIVAHQIATATERFTCAELVARYYRGEQLDRLEALDVARIVKYSPSGC